MKLVDITQASDKGTRNHMEDRLLVKQLSPSLTLLVALDGHGGDEASDFIYQKLQQWNFTNLQISISNRSRKEHCEYWIDQLHAAFQVIDSNFRAHYPTHEKKQSAGTTICGILVDCKLKNIIVFNIGDSQCVIVSPKYEFISTPHTVKSLRERKKILAEHPKAQFTDLEKDPRLYGLNMTRAFGNYNIRGLDKALNRDIDYTVLELEDQVFPLQIVIATDGLFDEISARKIANYVPNHKVDANVLLQMAQEIDSKGDNIGIIHARIKK